MATFQSKIWGQKHMLKIEYGPENFAVENFSDCGALRGCLFVLYFKTIADVRFPNDNDDVFTMGKYSRNILQWNKNNIKSMSMTTGDSSSSSESNKSRLHKHRFGQFKGLHYFGEQTWAKILRDNPYEKHI